MDIYDVIVIGGGSAGLTAAGLAAERGCSVLILEKNDELGKKLKITGGGRCNIYNAEFDTKKLLDFYGDAKKFLYSPFSQFAAQESFDLFDRLGLPTIVQARKRAFPHTENARDVYGALKNLCDNYNVEYKLNTPVTKLVREENLIEAVVSKKERFGAKHVVLSTGGVAAPETGSTGDGFKLLESIGHNVHKPTPNIVPLTTNVPYIHRMAGTSLSFMKIRFVQNGKTEIRRTGKVLFTHFGISGPLVLNVAQEVKELMHGGDVKAVIDMFPDTQENDLDRRIWRIFEQSKNKKVKNVLTELLPKSVLTEVFGLLSTDISELPVNEVSKESRKEFAYICKHFAFPITGTLGWDKAVIADGGVALDEIDFKTMRSKLFSNLYILGDLLHVNRPSGGFSLQLCWTTAYVAAQAIADTENKNARK